MENCGQCSLEKVVAAADKRRLAPSEAFFVFSQILEGLEVLHQFGGCHRGISPKNIIIQKDLKVKLIGFHNAVRWCETIPGKKDGVGLALEGEISTNALCLLQDTIGDYRFVPPEVILNSPYDGRVVDIWALSVTLYYMVTGTYPFQGKV